MKPSVAASYLRPELLEKIQNWLISFHRLDPRYKILTFFNQVASDGADNMYDDSDDESEIDYYDMSRGAHKIELDSKQKLLSDIFNATSILTVWRPCSNDAMRKMMEGSGVGKGLDIKGKSAKKGLLSAFVPFMQIHEEMDKVLIQPIEKGAKLRVYYQSAEARQRVMDTLKPLSRDEAEYDYAVIPSKMKCIDKYAEKNMYGLELSQRLFWKGYVTDQDISRNDETETGRPSIPGFQDANNKTLKMALKKEKTPLPVVYQYDAENPMRPQTLLMAYEENGTVTPVVSDFDGFLLGWRREALWMGCNIPREQEELMMWCINHIERILDQRPTTDTWTVQWLEVLKKEANEGFIPEIPEYGFGDRKSYSIMEKAAKRLIDTGAVRHGSECFNYYFPQEIDDMFLLISDTLSPVPWKYVNVEDLQAILSQKIREGFVFPLNPKWILCDPGWKKLYDELMASEALYADESKDVWYPPFLGVREKIEAIHKRHPLGFQQRLGRYSFEAKQGYSPLRQNLEKGVAMSGNAAFDLAELELENYTSRKNMLARQIHLASLDEMPEEEEEKYVAPKSPKGNKNSGRRVSKRTMFRLQRTEDFDSDTNKGSTSTVGSITSDGRGSGVVSSPVPQSDKRSLLPVMHSSALEPRRNFSDILPIDADLDMSNHAGSPKSPTRPSPSQQRSPIK